MKETVVKALVDGLYGKNTHLNPKKVVEGLTPANAKIKPENDNHSCWELLHHIKIWQKAIVEAIKGKEVDWKDISKNHNWPSAICNSGSSSSSTRLVAEESPYFGQHARHCY